MNDLIFIAWLARELAAIRYSPTPAKIDDLVIDITAYLAEQDS
jgi:hypothetical protein